MKVLRAKHAGACYGVQRALKLAKESARISREVYTLGPLIHNPRVVSELENKGVHVAKCIEDANGGTIIIRSHGISSEVYDALSERTGEVVDATCPHVARAQKAAEALAKNGCHVVVVGEAGHPEVEGLVSWAKRAGGSVSVVASSEELPEEIFEPVGIVVHTTQPRELLERVVDVLHARNISPIVKNTICFATRQRQDAAAHLAKKVDAMVVIGGRNSSNTTRLAEICACLCKEVHHIESADELKPEWFLHCARVGVTAGASTPEEHIEAVISALENFE